MGHHEHRDVNQFFGQSQPWRELVGCQPPVAPVDMRLCGQQRLYLVRSSEEHIGIEGDVVENHKPPLFHFFHPCTTDRSVEVDQMDLLRLATQQGACACQAVTDIDDAVLQLNVTVEREPRTCIGPSLCRPWSARLL